MPSSDLRALVGDLQQEPARAQKEVRDVINRGGLEIKKRMQDEMGRSRSFRPVAASIDYDEIGGADNPGVEVGPNAATGRAAPLAGIAYFGGARGGGGTVPDPRQALEDEAQEVVKQIEKIAGDAL